MGSGWLSWGWRLETRDRKAEQSRAEQSRDAADEHYYYHYCYCYYYYHLKRPTTASSTPRPWAPAADSYMHPLPCPSRVSCFFSISLPAAMRSPDTDPIQGNRRPLFVLGVVVLLMLPRGRRLLALPFLIWWLAGGLLAGAYLQQDATTVYARINFYIPRLHGSIACRFFGVEPS